MALRLLRRARLDGFDFQWVVFLFQEERGFIGGIKQR
jgi:hypothetical protein